MSVTSKTRSEPSAAASGAMFDRRTIEKLLSGLKSRVFLMHNVHDDAPVLFHTRWAMSYLSGPLTREQVLQVARLLVQESSARLQIDKQITFAATDDALHYLIDNGDANAGHGNDLDGYDDIVVTAWPREEAGLTNTGRAWLVYGGPGFAGSASAGTYTNARSSSV